MPRADCTCSAATWYERHEEGCPRRNDLGPQQEIREALARRHPFNRGEWVTWPEVFRIDVFAMRFWTGGEGQVRVAYEIKVSRADFLAELKRPEKRARALELAHRFYFATPKGLVAQQEIPRGCGLIELSGGKMRVKVKAPLLAPRWFTEGETLSLLRMDLFRTGAQKLAFQAERWRSAYQQQGVTLEAARMSLREAERALERLAGKPEPGTRWRGLWGRSRLRRDRMEMTVVEVVESARVRSWVDFCPTDGLAVSDSLPVGEFLRRFEPVAA